MADQLRLLKRIRAEEEVTTDFVLQHAGVLSVWSVGEVSCVCRPCRVERDSVNSVALCDGQSLPTSGASVSAGDTLQCSSRMMVAASVQLNSAATAYTARDTTIMPSIPALLPIVVMTFAPNAELRFIQSLNYIFCLSSAVCDYHYLSV